MSFPQGDGRLSARQVGNDLVITYTGSASAVYVYVDGSKEPPIKVPLDEDGKGRIPVPAGAQSVTISDCLYPDNATTYVEIVES